MSGAASSPAKRPRTTDSSPTKSKKSRSSIVEPEGKDFIEDEPESRTFNHDEEGAQEWRDALQDEATERAKEDAEFEAGVPGSVRIEDLDESLKEALSSITVKDPSKALIKFTELLKRDSDGHLLHQYVLLSPKCAEVMSVWSQGPAAESALPLLYLLHELLKHPMGRNQDNSVKNSMVSYNNHQSRLVQVRLDKLARSIVSSKLKDIYSHLTSGERRRQRAALLLMASIVRRGVSLASEVATKFDFSLNSLPKLCKVSKTSENKKRYADFTKSVRFAFIQFAMSLLEVSHAALLRWVLQIRILFTGVLHRLASDDEETIVYVLKVLQQKVLDPSSLIPPGLQSVIFGDATLEQLALISSRSVHSEASHIANDVLMSLCTDPTHGICPEPTLSWESQLSQTGAFGGGQGRLIRLMLKLKATENQNHRELLLSIAAGRPIIVAAYFESFPYSLEPRPSPAWFAAVSLISDIILVTRLSVPFTSLTLQGLPPPPIDNPLLQGALKSALPQNLTRLVINRGLLHNDPLVKHGCLRLLFEVLSAVEYYLVSIRKAFENLRKIPLASKSDASDKSNQTSLGESSLCEKWLTLERHVQNELRGFVPDPQVILSILFSKSDMKRCTVESSTMRHGDEDLLDDLVTNDTQSSAKNDTNDIEEHGDDCPQLIDIWNADEDLIQTGDLNDVGSFLNAKLFEVLAAYQRIVPMSLLECSFDVFKLLPEEPAELPLSQQKSLLMLLSAATGGQEGLSISSMLEAGGERYSRHMYKYLKPLLKLMLQSSDQSLKQQSQCLVYIAMSNCGAFESNKSEIGIWLQFLPVYDDAVISFFCDVVDTVGKNIDKYVDSLLLVMESAGNQDFLTNPEFGPLCVCVLDKCVRVLASSAKSFSVPQRISIAIYVANALGVFIQSQGHSTALCILVKDLLSTEKCRPLTSNEGFSPEWSPLQGLLLHAQCCLKENKMGIGFSLSGDVPSCRLKKALNFCKNDKQSSSNAKAYAMSSSLLCASPRELVANFPLLMDVFFSVFNGKCPTLAGLFGAHRGMLIAIGELYPDYFQSSISLASSISHSKTKSYPLYQDRNFTDSISGINANTEICVSAFSVFLLSLPFQVLFPAALIKYEAGLLRINSFTSILESVLFEVPAALWSTTANMIMFYITELWTDNDKGVDVLDEVNTCFCLLKSMCVPTESRGWLKLLQSEGIPRNEVLLVADFIKGILVHPLMDAHLRSSGSLCLPESPQQSEDIMEDEDTNIAESWFYRAKSSLSVVERNVFEILEEFLKWATELPKKKMVSEALGTCEVIQKVILTNCKPVLNEVMLGLKKASLEIEKDESCGLSPCLANCMGFAFSSYMDVESIIDLSCAMLSVNTQKTDLGSQSLLFQDMGLHFAASAFCRITELMEQREMKHVGKLTEPLFEQLLKLAITRQSERVFTCLLSCFDAYSMYRGHIIEECVFKSYGILLSNCIHKAPTTLLTHLMKNVDRTKAEILLHLIQVSPVHLAKFLDIFCQRLGIKVEPLMGLVPVLSSSSQSSCTNEYAKFNRSEMILLLPTVNWLLSTLSFKDHASLKSMAQKITMTYIDVIKHVIRKWNIFGAKIGVLEFLPYIETSEIPFEKRFASTMAGQVVLMFKKCMLHQDFTSKQKIDILNSLVEKSYPLLHLSLGDVGALSVEDTLKVVSTTIAKWMIMKMLVLNYMSMSDCANEITSKKQEMITGSSYDLVNILISTIRAIIKQKAFETKDSTLGLLGSEACISKYHLLQALESVLLRDLKNVLNTLNLKGVEDRPIYMPLLKKFTKLVLQFRFAVRLPMQALRCFVHMVVCTPEASREYSTYAFDLLLGHSQFALTLLSCRSNSRRHLLAGWIREKENTGKSLSSVLYLLRSPLVQRLTSNNSVKDEHSEVCTDMEVKKLELIKFVRVLYYLKRQTAGTELLSEPIVNSQELLSLLLASYDASLSEIDREILMLMREIEMFEGPGFPGLEGMDYLWGEAALKRRQDKTELEECHSADHDTTRELKGRHFKEDLVLDPERCALGVLFFPVRQNLLKASWTGEYLDDEAEQGVVKPVERLLMGAAYDPSFALPFSFHSLSCGWINAEEFVGKGLLALSLVSIASAEEDMRKLGYEILAKLFTIIEDGTSFKGKPQIKLLLSFIKNMISEPWQRLSFTVALFAAEASCILMNPSDSHYPIVNRFLLRAPGIDDERIPLFKQMFGSGSVHFRSDRAWMLRLLAFGLRTSFDTHIYRRRFVVEIMMSFYNSPLADKHTREWILQIVHRATKLRALAQYLIERSGVLSWLTSILSSNGAAKSGEYAVGVSNELVLDALQILENTLSWRSAKRWLLSEGFEELSKVIWMLHSLFVYNSESGHHLLIKPYLRILGIAFTISHARKKFQSHLKIGVRDFWDIVQIIQRDKCSLSFETKLLALRTILESSPPACLSHQDKIYLYEIGTWGFSLLLKEHSFSLYSLGTFDGDTAKKDDSSSCDFEGDQIITRFVAWLAASLNLGALQTGVTSLKSLNKNRECNDSLVGEQNINMIRLLINLHCLAVSSRKSSSYVSVVWACAVLLLDSHGKFSGFQDIFSLLIPPEADTSWRWKSTLSCDAISAFETHVCDIFIAIFEETLDSCGYQSFHDLLEPLKTQLKALLKCQEVFDKDNLDFRIRIEALVK